MVQKSSSGKKEENKKYTLTAPTAPQNADTHQIRVDGDTAVIDDLEGELDPEDKGYLQLTAQLRASI
jgi:hypothetical protein